MGLFWRTIAVLLCLVALAGCRTLAQPAWSKPGSADVQRARALRYDPYPESEPGPALVGVRPREYEVAPPEPSRARWHLGGWGQ
ncbi:MAG: membrane or secreted protein [Pirellulaceae bacterium]|nr:membrane or secreted protein [Pirellulaceae bacterium]